MGAKVQEPSLMEVFRRLLEAYGSQRWWPAESAFEVIVGAILTQAASWRNVEKAIASLKAAGVFSPEGLRRVPLEELAGLIRSAGYFNAKARKLKAFMEHVGQAYQDDLRVMFSHEPAELREELLSIYGVGEETADDILLYAGRLPFFVVDAYTRRIFRRLRLGPDEEGYEPWQRFFMSRLRRDVRLFNEYHALLVHHGKDRCRKAPRCGGCPLLDVCATGQAQVS